MQKVCGGELKLEEFDEMSRINQKSKLGIELNKNWKENFTFLMKYGKLTQAKIDQRLRQLEIYLKISGIKEITMALLEIKQNNGMTGNFKFLENIAESVSDLFLKFEFSVKFIKLVITFVLVGH